MGPTEAQTNAAMFSHGVTIGSAATTSALEQAHSDEMSAQATKNAFAIKQLEEQTKLAVNSATAARENNRDTFNALKDNIGSIQSELQTRLKDQNTDSHDQQHNAFLLGIANDTMSGLLAQKQKMDAAGPTSPHIYPNNFSSGLPDLQPPVLSAAATRELEAKRQKPELEANHLTLENREIESRLRGTYNPTGKSESFLTNEWGDQYDAKKGDPGLDPTTATLSQDFGTAVQSLPAASQSLQRVTSQVQPLLDNYDRSGAQQFDLAGAGREKIIAPLSKAQSQYETTLSAVPTAYSNLIQRIRLGVAGSYAQQALNEVAGSLQPNQRLNDIQNYDAVQNAIGQKLNPILDKTNKGQTLTDEEQQTSKRYGALAKLLQYGTNAGSVYKQYAPKTGVSTEAGSSSTAQSPSSSFFPGAAGR